MSRQYENHNVNIPSLREYVGLIDRTQKKAERIREKYNKMRETISIGRDKAEAFLAKGDIDQYAEWQNALVKAHKDINSVREEYTDILIELNQYYDGGRDLLTFAVLETSEEEKTKAA